MVNRSTPRRFFTLGILPVLLVLALSHSGAQAQQRLSRSYPAGKNVRIQLKNISGTITVESWNKDIIKISASLETPTANVLPRLFGEGGVVVDVMGDNRGRGDVGDVNFKLQVPVNSSVDLETKRGQIYVRNIRGGLVRAHVTSEGDIELTGILATQVFAQNNIGDIFFDGEFSRGGTYQFQSTKGNISIRIPVNTPFNLTAAAPSRQIALNEFWNKDFKNLGDGRKFVSDIKDGRPSVTVTNFQGSISFLRR